MGGLKKEKVYWTSWRKQRWIKRDSEIQPTIYCFWMILPTSHDHLLWINIKQRERQINKETRAGDDVTEAQTREQFPVCFLSSLVFVCGHIIISWRQFPFNCMWKLCCDENRFFKKKDKSWSECRPVIWWSKPVLHPFLFENPFPCYSLGINFPRETPFQQQGF